MTRLRTFLLVVLCVGIAALGSASRSTAQEPPYFVTYSHALEEPDNLEVAMKTTTATPQYGNRFNSATLEIEYGATAWWTTELYLSGQTTSHDSTLFNGFRLENRFRPLLREHFINPVLYVEYEDINFADRSLLEITGHATKSDYTVANAIGHPQVERSIETKLILSSNVRGWNLSENFIAEKALNEVEPWEFGYALGVSRPLSLVASAKACVLCRENFAAGLELYGGLGDAHSFGWHSTSQYLGPTLAFTIPKGPTVMFSPNIGLNDNSLGIVYRFKVSYEFQQFFRHLRKDLP